MQRLPPGRPVRAKLPDTDSATLTPKDAVGHVRALVESPRAETYLGLDDLLEDFGTAALTGLVPGIADSQQSRVWPLAIGAAAALGDTVTIQRTLVAAATITDEAERVADRPLGQSGLLLLAAAEAAAAAAAAGRISPGDDACWPLLLRVMSDPWLTPAADRRDRNQGTDTPPGPALQQAVDEFQILCRERETERERRAVASEIRRVVAHSGPSQRAFARRVGTTPSRLSSYLCVTVMPSAAMMLRV